MNQGIVLTWYLLAFVILLSSTYAQTLMEALESTPELSDFNTIVSNISMFLGPDDVETFQAVLDEKPNLTVFAPSNDAFRALSTDEFEGILSSPEMLRDILLTHILPGRFVASEDSEPVMIFMSFSDDPVVFTMDDSTGSMSVASSLSSAEVTSSAIEIDDAVVYLVDDFLVPMDVADVFEEASSEIFLDLLMAAPMDEEDIGDAEMMTIFVPIDSAIEGIEFGDFGDDDLSLFVSGYVVPSIVLIDENAASDMRMVENLAGDDLEIGIEDGEARINGSLIMIPNVVVGDFVFHFIETPLGLGDMGLGTILDTLSEMEGMEGLVDIIRGSPAFSEIASVLSDPEGEVTFFAPTELPDVSDEELAEIVGGGILGFPLDIDALMGMPPMFTTSATGEPLGIGFFGGDAEPSVMFGIPGMPDFSADILSPGMETGDGILYLLDRPIEPRRTFGDIVDGAPSDISDIAGLLELAEASGGLDALRSDDFPVTLFLPTDDALAGAGISLDDLDGDEIGAVARGLIVPGGTLFSSDVDDTGIITVEALDGGVYELSRNADGNLVIDGATITTPDMIFDRGVIHTIGDMVEA